MTPILAMATVIETPTGVLENVDGTIIGWGNYFTDRPEMRGPATHSVALFVIPDGRLFEVKLNRIVITDIAIVGKEDV